MSTLTLGAIDTLTALQKQIGVANEKQGFHEQGTRLRTFITQPELGNDSLHEQDVANYRHYVMAKIGLIVTEAAEGIEEIRKGHAATETYYPSWQAAVDASADGWESVPFELGAFKPEGLPSELADVVIRAFDLAHETGIDLAAAIDEKLTYNATRARLHGKKL